MKKTSLAGRSILIVEDEPLVALDIVTEFEQVGAHKPSTARRTGRTCRFWHELKCFIVHAAKEQTLIQVNAASGRKLDADLPDHLGSRSVRAPELPQGRAAK
jgi:hypothetical protein